MTTPAAAVIKKAVVAIKGNQNIATINGKKCEREAIKKMDLAEGIVYLGRNSNQEKCANCSPNAKSVNWMRITFNQDNLTQDLWICEKCNRSFPSGKGKKNYESLIKK